ncbi:hypothetical protein WA026_008982 [Henosepilachna vigintioctopunctata]|uniref:Uncharacterized protein n=1 Tax=Henosepilachna vigintioctopunctata TaxID=420089 RepID=A0AAW1VCS9_9CUCU
MLFKRHLSNRSGIMDMNLIEILWKQDVDLGFTLDVNTEDAEDPKSAQDASTAFKHSNNVEATEKIVEKPNEKIQDTEEKENVDVDPWKGVNYTIDTETGENFGVGR